MSSIREQAEKIAYKYLDRTVGSAKLQADIEQALRDERERAAKIIEDHQAQDKCEDNCWTTIKAAIRKEG